VSVVNYLRQDPSLCDGKEHDFHDIRWCIRCKVIFKSEAFEAGAEWMREEAAKVAESYTVSPGLGANIASAIRALPTKEETCTPSKKGHP
jgi:hypothetical protein